MVFLAMAGLAEFYGLAEKRRLVCFKWCGLLGGVLLMAGHVFASDRASRHVTIRRRA